MNATAPREAPHPDAAYADVYVHAQDGLRLYARDYGPRGADAVPVVCLPGLARNSGDFDVLARALAGNAAHPRRVIALDYRGRGRSDYDPDPANYSVPVECADTLALLAALGIARAIFVGTSRGGILIMTLAVLQPGLIAGAVLNDIGPVIELQGLIRIKGYVGKMREPRSFEDGATILSGLFGPQFPRLSAGDWLAAAKRNWVERDGRFKLNYDPKLADALASVDLAHPMPALWEQFDALSAIPLMAVRGALSDILSAQTVDAMRARRPDLDVLEVPDQGHAPLLAEPDTIARVAAFIARIAEL